MYLSFFSIENVFRMYETMRVKPIAMRLSSTIVQKNEIEAYYYSHPFLKKLVDDFTVHRRY